MAKKIKKRQLFYIILLLAMIVAIFAALYLVSNRQLIRKEAVSSSVTLSLQPATLTYNLNETKTLELWATFTNGSAAEKLVYFKTQINFPKDIVQLADIIDVAPSQLNRIIRVELPTIANQSGQIMIQIGAVNLSDPRPSTNTAMKIAVLKFKAIQATSSTQTISINTANSEVTNSDYPDPINIPINNPSNTQFTVNPSVTGSITFNPTSPQSAPANQNCSYQVIWSAPGATSPYITKQVNINGQTPGNEANYCFPPTVPCVSPFNETLNSNTGGASAIYRLKNGDNTLITTGTFTCNVASVTNTPTPTPTPTNVPGATNTPTPTPTIGAGPTNSPTPTPTPNPNLVKVGTIYFKAKTGVSGSATVDFITAPQSKVVEQTTAADILGQTTGLTFTIGGGITPPAGTPIISFNFKFRDILRDIGQQTIIVRVKKGTFFKEFTNITSVHTSNGIYNALNVPLIGVSPGSDYEIFVKGPKHLAKGFKNITLVANNNPTFDFTSSGLEPGDLPPQDGVINSQDISRLIELLDVPSPTAADLNTADLNYDGVINGGDVNELILTLSTKYDEDVY